MDQCNPYLQYIFCTIFNIHFFKEKIIQSSKFVARRMLPIAAAACVLLVLVVDEANQALMVTAGSIQRWPIGEQVVPKKIKIKIKNAADR
jgi:hypothetical protein